MERKIKVEEERIHKKLFIHETDYHGQGYFGIIGEKDTFFSYSFEDSETGDVPTVVKTLINIGFINPDDVLFIDGMEIYEHLREED